MDIFFFYLSTDGNFFKSQEPENHPKTSGAIILQWSADGDSYVVLLRGTGHTH